MKLGNMPRLAAAAASALAVVALTGCSGEEPKMPDLPDVQAPSAEDARDAGREYGQTIMKTVGQRATPKELEDLCGQGAAQAAKDGNDGAAERWVDAFVDGCREAVALQ